MSTVDVVITGMGATTPLGGDVTSTWDALLAGRNGIRANDAEWVERFDLPARLAAQLAVDPTEVLPRVQAAQAGPLRAGRDHRGPPGMGGRRATRCRPRQPPVDPDRLGVVIGTGIGGAMTLLDQDDLLENARAAQGVAADRADAHAQRPGRARRPRADGTGRGARPGVGLRVRRRGLARAWRMIQTGRGRRRGGRWRRGVHPRRSPVAGFAQSRTLSTRNDEPDRASRPFDVDRDGFVLGEGAGVLVLERAEYAAGSRRADLRPARRHRHHVRRATTSPATDPEGVGQISAITQALRSAGRRPGRRRPRQRHATSTVVGDVGEAVAIRKAIGDHAVLTAPKGALGHLVGGAGAVESIITLLSIYDGIIPADAEPGEPGPEGRARRRGRRARKLELTAAVNDSFGFGGHNVALAFTAA